MKDRDQLKQELINLADDTLRVSKSALDALEVLIPESSVKDLNSLYNNTLKNHKTLVDQILKLDREEREERIEQYNKALEASDIDFAKYGLE